MVKGKILLRGEEKQFCYYKNVVFLTLFLLILSDIYAYYVVKLVGIDVRSGLHNVFEINPSLFLWVLYQRNTSASKLRVIQTNAHRVDSYFLHLTRLS